MKAVFTELGPRIDMTDTLGRSHYDIAMQILIAISLGLSFNETDLIISKYDAHRAQSLTQGLLFQYVNDTGRWCTVFTVSLFAT